VIIFIRLDGGIATFNKVISTGTQSRFSILLSQLASSE
jgi:hypothetical protein